MDRCSKHDETMDRLFTSVNEIEKDIGMISTKMDEVLSFKKDVHSIIYGNGQEGLSAKVRRALAQLYLQWALLIIILVAIAGFSFSK